jgi:lactoylglutathione lyase
MIKGIGHVAFNASDMEASLKFYCKVLGFTKAFEIRDDEGKPWINYIKVRDGQFIELFYGSPNANTPQSYSHLCLEVEDINKIAERIKSFGIVLDAEPIQGKDLNYQCWVRDPDGNRIEFMQMHPDSPQNKC